MGMVKFMRRFLRAEDGATAIEYGLIASLLVVVIIGAISALGQNVVNVLYSKIQTAL
jgi:pilus assembly protein Flp/PilA